MRHPRRSRSRSRSRSPSFFSGMAFSSSPRRSVFSYPSDDRYLTPPGTRHSEPMQNAISCSLNYCSLAFLHCACMCAEKYKRVFSGTCSPLMCVSAFVGTRLRWVCSYRTRATAVISRRRDLDSGSAESAWLFACCFL